LSLELIASSEFIATISMQMWNYFAIPRDWRNLSKAKNREHTTSINDLI